MFYALAAIISFSACAITIKTLIGYTSLNLWAKLGIAFGIWFCWFGYLIVGYFHHHEGLSLPVYKVLSYMSYIGLGFGFILLVLILVRDFAWFSSYGIAKIAKVGCCERLDPFNNFYLNVANIVTVVIAVFLTVWGIYEAEKFPEIKEITIKDAKIKEPFKLVQINDLHINRTTSVEKIEKFVEQINALNADAIAIVGDVVDELPANIEKQMQALSKLKSKYGRFTVFGNHDLYSGLLPWIKGFGQYNMGLLFNNGFEIKDKIYIAGIPDKSIEKMSAMIKIDLPKALSENKNNLYTVLLSHSPYFTDDKIKGIDLQLSGHTHGGQIFPFHFLVKAANKYLAGLYENDGYKLYVSRGAGYWGPPVRVLAPSEITVINLEPENKF